MYKNSWLPYKLMGVLLLWPWMILAADNDFAWQWPLTLAEANAGAYQVTLDTSVYQAAYWPDWRDIQVLDADNQIIPAVLYPANAPQTQTSSQEVDLPWFVLPTHATTSTDLSVVVKRDNNGSVITINDSAVTLPTHNNSPSWLIDSGTHSGQLRALSVEWKDAQAVLDAGYRLETSADLRQWRVLVPEVRLLQLHNDTEQLRNNRITFNTAQRYLRLVPLQSNVPVPTLHRLRGEVVQKSIADTGATWHWLELTAQAEHESGGFEYRTSGRFPIQRLDLIMPVNSTATWWVFSHEEEETHDPLVHASSWVMRNSNWFTMHINGKNADAPVQTSPPLDLGQTLSSQQWRLQPISPAALPAAPTLRLGWQAGHVIFLAQGRAPYLLVAGSADGMAKPNHNRTLEPMLAALRQHHNGQWQPATATLGEAVLRAGDSAYFVAPVKPDRQKVLLKLLLWGVLISGVLIVVQFATNLLRRLPKPPPDHKDD